MTPDLDKLKERYNDWLLAQSGDDDAIAAEIMTDLPALIAKAERVDALTEALRPFAQVAEGEAYKLFAQQARLTFTLCRPDGKRFCFINAECFDAARNALSPKESE